MSSPVTAIDVVRSHDGANKLLRRVIQLVGGLGAAKHAEAAGIVFCDRPAKSLGHPLQSLIPRGSSMAAVFTDQWLS